jgi:hypothetical protein
MWDFDPRPNGTNTDIGHLREIKEVVYGYERGSNRRLEETAQFIYFIYLFICFQRESISPITGGIHNVIQNIHSPLKRVNKRILMYF